MGREDFGYEKLMHAVDTIPGTLLVCDKDRHVVYHNSVVCTALNIEEKKLFGSKLDHLIEEGYIINSATMEAFETGKLSIRYVRGRMTVPILTVSTPVLNEKGEVEYVVAFSLTEDLLENISKEMVDSRMRSMEVLDFLSTRAIGDNTVLAESPIMKNLLQFLRRVAGADSTILLTGETGTGKEVLAKYIHANSRRSSQVFIPVSCAAIPETLMESEFFGYEKGAFTGANREGKAGIFELAENGTLFLDEIGEMPLPIQAKFLRVIETGEVSRLGSEHSKTINFRLVAATNRNLQEMCKEGTFRSDLYYRLNIVSVEIPPLRERKEDIVPLAKLFLNSLNKKYKTSKVLSYEAIRRLESYFWPGNVRELRNVIERLAITSESDILDFHEDQPLFSYSQTTKSKPPASLFPAKEPKLTGSLKEIMKFFEKQVVLSALEQNNGNVAKAANLLQIHKSALYRKLEYYRTMR